MSRRLQVEAEAAEYVLGLDAFGLGGKAVGIYHRAQVRDVRPLLVRQRALLTAGTADADAEVAVLDEEIARAWERCLEALRILWLTEGPKEEAHEAQ